MRNSGVRCGRCVARCWSWPARVRAELRWTSAAESHVTCEDPGYNCAALGWSGSGGTGDPCDCGRDERALRYLRLLAGMDEAAA